MAKAPLPTLTKWPCGLFSTTSSAETVAPAAGPATEEVLCIADSRGAAEDVASGPAAFGARDEECGAAFPFPLGGCGGGGSSIRSTYGGNITEIGGNADATCHTPEAQRNCEG